MKSPRCISIIPPTFIDRTFLNQSFINPLRNDRCLTVEKFSDDEGRVQLLDTYFEAKTTPSNFANRTQLYPGRLADGHENKSTMAHYGWKNRFKLLFFEGK